MKIICRRSSNPCYTQIHYRWKVPLELIPGWLLCAASSASGCNQAGWKGEFLQSRSAHQPVGQERLCSCALGLNQRIRSLQECVAVQLSASQPPTRPGMTLSLSQKWKTNRGFVFPALESNSAVFRSSDTCGFSSEYHQPLWGLTLACWECVGELIWFIYLRNLSHKLIICISTSPLKHVDQAGLVYCY